MEKVRVPFTVYPLRELMIFRGFGMVNTWRRRVNRACNGCVDWMKLALSV